MVTGALREKCRFCATFLRENALADWKWGNILFRIGFFGFGALRIWTRWLAAI
jgi:hypothetical protein